MTEEFDGFALEPSSWLEVAREHLMAAEALGTCLVESGSAERIKSKGHAGRLGMMRGCMLLMALALENAFKGVIVAQDRVFIDSAGRLTWPKQHGLRTGHELVPLAAIAGLENSESEQDLLARLSEYSVWAGKYSIPKKRDHFSEGARARRKLHLQADLRIAQALLTRSEQAVMEANG